MNAPFHDGELAVQARAGVVNEASRIGRGIHPTIPPVAREFLSERAWLVAGSTGADGRVWASILAGAPGFLRALDERTVRVDAEPTPGDPLNHNLGPGAAVGFIAMDLVTRRRMRLNGLGERHPDGGLLIRTLEVFSNCPKYIQLRESEAAVLGEEKGMRPIVRRAPELSDEQRAWIAAADTFFVASAHPHRGADVSHRGGLPGFVRGEGPTRLVFPDYSGNRMFQTLGNIAINPRTGLLFVDFEQGSTLQLTGRATIVWDETRRAAYPGAERIVEFEVDEVIETDAAIPLRWRLVEYSPFNPSLDAGRGAA